MITKNMLANFIGPRPDPAHHYPLDLDGSLRFTRPYVIDMFPYPTPIGMVQGFMKQINGFILLGPNSMARKPYGPNVNAVPTYADYQVAVAGLVKRS